MCHVEIMQNMVSVSSKRKGPITWSGRRGADIEFLWKKKKTFCGSSNTFQKKRNKEEMSY